MSKILITGGAGYIGSILVPQLLKECHEVTVLDNFMYGQESLLDCCHHQNLNIVKGDVRNQKLLQELVSQADVVIPLACIVGAPACDKNPWITKNINVFQILDICKAAKGKIVVYPNTNSGYGIGQENRYCDENSPLKPISEYGKQKVEAEKLILGMNWISLRLATVFGVSPRMRTDLLVNNFVLMAVTQGYIELSEKHFKRNYIHIRDVVRAFLHCLINFEKMRGEAYNVGLSNANLSKLELCQEIQKQIPELRIYENESRKDLDQRNYIVSNAKIEATGFRPTYSLQDGIAELIKTYKIIRINKYENI